ncbi:DUF6364 family protein [Methanobrevibacter curvatus]|uniref:Uncharacterized protein n=1 Tax=Methanobrevibacter curvatus TaxID=49547 RepID=A0A165ZI10_9EURY|nr:DUF6364 family protein [Methanobrevibacter curvatus]KZX10762.1 hypothetical protein MBCUR_16770 [Methanobrevibacter curvatus]
MQNRVKTTLSLDKDIIKSIKLVALNKDTTQTKIINEYLKQGLMNEEDINKENKIPEHLILNKSTYNPDHEKLMSMAGIAKNGKPFSSVELIRKMREGGHDIP